VVEALAAGRVPEAGPGGLEPAEQALLAFVETVTRQAYRTTDAQVQGLRDVGWSDEQIAEAVYITALFAFFNRVADAFGIRSQGYGGPRPEWEE